jgi:hypothetical protein
MLGLSTRVAQFTLNRDHARLASEGRPELRNALSDVRRSLANRAQGIVVLRTDGLALNYSGFAAFQTAISHALGPVLPEIGEDGRLFRFLVSDSDRTDAAAKTRRFRLHTDGPYHNPSPDWVALGKLEDTTHARSVLLHIDDWAEGRRFAEDPRARRMVNWREPDFFGPEEKRRFAALGVETGVAAPVFYGNPESPNIRFRFRPYDSMRRPSAICGPEMLDYLEEIAGSLGKGDGAIEIDFGVHDILVFNNQFVLHGRTAFEEAKAFRRVLVRTRGYLQSSFE